MDLPATADGETSASQAPGAEPAVREALRLVRERGARHVELWFTELGGRLWRIALRADDIDERLFSSGLDLDGPSIGGGWRGLVRLLPDPAAAYPEPLARAPTVALLCHVGDAAAGSPYPHEPRLVLRRAQEELLRASGATACLAGAEAEFVLLDAGGRPAAQGPLWDFLRSFAQALVEAGIPVDAFRAGPGPGQGRVQMRAAAPLATADRVMLYRQTARELARRAGLSARFLPKPVAAGPGAGMPVHVALWRDGANLFHDDAGWCLTSAACRWFAGGLLRHARALCALCAPTTNSYRRLVPGSGAPTQVVFARGGLAACRIPARSPSPAARRVRFGCPDPSANPYLALAAILLAGLDGLERKLEPPAGGGELPHCLEEALGALREDSGFLLRGGAFTPELLEAWHRDRWERHVLPVRTQPHPVELELEDGYL